MSKTREETFEAISGCLVMLLALPLSVLLGGFVLTKLWAWFIVPQFDAKPLSLAMAIGLDLVVSVLQTQPHDPPKKEDATIWDAIGLMVGRAVIGPLILLAFGAVVVRFL